MRDLQTPVTTALAERYAVQREVGRGAAGAVFLAQDKKLKREVAIKVLLPEIASETNAERFLREIQIAAGLTHPQIVPLYESGQEGGFLFYVMPYIAGPTLRDRLQAVRQLSFTETTAIVSTVAKALTFAHERGIVHRDIKPDNVLMAGGDPIVTDFGVARAFSMAGSKQLTQTGMTVGTPAYMSPEQGRGRRDIDGRSDIYSLACMTYEMLGGHPPFFSQSPQEILTRHAMDPIPSLRACRPDVPSHIERAILKALAKKPADRYATAVEFAVGLTAETGPPDRGATMWGAIRSLVDRPRKANRPPTQ